MDFESRVEERVLKYYDSHLLLCRAKFYRKSNSRALYTSTVDCEKCTDSTKGNCEENRVFFGIIRIYAPAG